MISFVALFELFQFFQCHLFEWAPHSIEYVILTDGLIDFM